MTIHQVLGRNVRQLRELKHWSQDLLSENSDLHRTYISGVERGVRNPTLSIIERLAQALEVSPAQLLKEEAE